MYKMNIYDGKYPRVPRYSCQQARDYLPSNVKDASVFTFASGTTRSKRLAQPRRASKRPLLRHRCRPRGFRADGDGSSGDGPQPRGYFRGNVRSPQALSRIVIRRISPAENNSSFSGLPPRGGPNALPTRNADIIDFKLRRFRQKL